jgi:methylated-DNA-[protein]-cysteine S-methyltransferase
LQLHVFQSELGWMAALGREGSLVQLVIGCESPVAAVARLDARWTNAAEEARWCASLARRLQAYAAGSTVSFDDVPVEIQDRTSFQVRVLECCRNIGRGQTISYGELARLAGRPGAARAVGNVMAGNRCPLVIPCHRVVHADGRIGRFSAPQGARLKRRLLELEC